MSLRVARIAPRTGFEPVEGGARTDPFSDFFSTLFEPQGAANLPGPGTVIQQTAAKAQIESVKLGTAIAQTFGAKPKLGSGAPTPSSPPKAGGGGGGDDRPKKPTGRPARISDFKTAAKIAAAGAAVTAAGLGVNEAAKQLGDTLNDAAETTGKVIENAADGIGKGLSNVGESVGAALSPILDPLGITDPKTQAEIGKWLAIAVAVGIGIFAFVMVVKRK